MLLDDPRDLAAYGAVVTALLETGAASPSPTERARRGGGTLMPVNAGASLSQSEARHLLRRAGFGPDQRTFDAIKNLTRGAAADYLLNFKPKAFKPGGSDFQKLHDKWV